MQGAVAETARVALELGYEVIIVEDATAGYDFSIDTGCTVAGTEVHWIELASLASLGCLVTDTEFTTQNL
jgi:nicotinamidase-related amidase